MYYSSYVAMTVYIICYIYIARGTYHSASKNGYFLGVVVLLNKIVKGSATKANLITNAMALHKPQLVGIDFLLNSEDRAEYVSHFQEMDKIHSSLNKDLIYLPITNQVQPLMKGPDGKTYRGILHDGLVYDVSKDTIVEKIEFKSKQNQWFNESKMAKLAAKYEPIGVNRIDLCCQNSDAYKQTVLNINKMDPDLSPVKFKAKDFSEIFEKKIHTGEIYHVDKVIHKQMELKPVLLDVQYRLLTDPDFFSQNSTNEINIAKFEAYFSCTLNF